MNQKTQKIPVICVTGTSDPATEALRSVIETTGIATLAQKNDDSHDVTIVLEDDDCLSSPLTIPCLLISNKHHHTPPSKFLYIIQPPASLSDIHSAIKMLQENRLENDKISLGSCVLDIKARQLIKQHETVRLTEKETAMLAYLHNKMPGPVSREELLHEVWKYADGIDTHTIETHIYRLRQKIEDDPANAQILITDKNGGYLLG